MLTHEFQDALTQAQERFRGDDFATIEEGRLKLKRDDKVVLPPAVATLQKVIDTRLPAIRIEQLLMEVDQLTQFSHHFTPLQNSQARPQHFYRTLLATLISQATNLGVVSMSASVKDTTVAIANIFRHLGRPLLPHAGHRYRGLSLEGESKKVNYLQVFKKDTIIIRPYFRLLLQESILLSADAKNSAYRVRI